MTATTLTTEPHPLLDTFTGDLVLRISGPSRSGQVVRLASAKCTVGSAPHCTLRLVAHGVAPLHCLLLRGPAATIVRCWSADTRLNDKSFTDALLSRGDRLSIGPIELEVLDVGATSPVPQPETEHDECHRAANQQREQFASPLAEFEAERDTLATERDDLEIRRNALAEERRQSQADQEEAQREMAKQREQLAAQSAQLESQRSALAEERRQWQTDQEIDLAAGQQRAQLDAQLAELDSQRKALATEREGLQTRCSTLVEERRQWQADQEEAQREFDQQREQIAVRSAELESQRSALAAERNVLETQRNALAEQRQQWHAQYEETQRGINEQLAAQLAALESQWNALREESQQWQAKHGEAQRGVDEQLERLNRQLAELESQRTRLAAERDGFEADRAALTEERRQWQFERGALRDAARQDAEKRQRQVEAQLAELESLRAHVAGARDSLAAERKALAEQRRLWELQRVELPRQEQPAARTELPSTTSSHALPAATPESPATPAPQFEKPTKRLPVDLNELFGRVGAKLALPQEGEPAATTPIKTPPLRTVPRPANAHRPQQSPAASAAAEGKEESIDDYMSRLMQRVRPGTGESQDRPRAKQRHEPTRAARQTSPDPTAVEPSQPAVATAQPPDEPEPVEARPRTPPKHIELSAFRELANMSARHAIQQHSRRTLVRAMHGKLTVTFVAFVASIGLFWLWRQFGACKLTFCSSLLATVVAIFWGLEYAILTGRVIVGRSGHIRIGRKGSSSPGTSAGSPARDGAAENSTDKDAGNPAKPS